VPELKPSRAYHEALRRIGVQNPGEVGVQTPIFLTAAVDDFSHLVAPISVTVVSFGTNTSAFVGENSGIELVAGARTKGVFVTLIQERNSATAQYYVGVPAGVTLSRKVLARPILCFTGPPPQSVVNEVTFDSVPEGSGVISGSDIVPSELLLEPGQSFFILRNTQNVNANFSIDWREIPTTGPVEP